MSKPASLSSLETHVGYWMRHVSNHVSHAFSVKLEAHGVTVAEWVVLRELWETGATAPSASAERLGLTRGAVSKLVERLVGKELVSRNFDASDKRCQIVELTATGRELVPRLAAAADANDAEFFGHLDESQRVELIALLRGIVAKKRLRGTSLD